MYRIWLVFSALFLCLDALPAIAGAQSQKVIIGGAQSLMPAVGQYSKQFHKAHPGVEIEIRGGGSNYAIDAARRGEIQIGLVTRNLTSAEKAGLHVQSFGRDAIILVTYPGNPITNLTLGQLRGIYLRQISNWSELGGENKGIIPLTREQSAGIHTLFIQHLFGRDFNGLEKAFTLRASKEKILKTIKRIVGSMGYGIFPLEEARSQGVKLLAIEGRAPTEGNIRDGLYPFSRPQSMIAPATATGIVREWMAGFAMFANQDAASIEGL
ncbi:MAG: substrate-binding domain-containing protein [Deltaproteobacteria bacterium]|nr:substrate-binding domain-containing protein [Deltaproteobacteria bacterium]